MTINVEEIPSKELILISVFLAQTNNKVLMRLHCTEETGLNFPCFVRRMFVSPEDREDPVPTLHAGEDSVREKKWKCNNQ